MFKQTLLNAFKSNIFKSVFESLPSTKRPDWINLISCISILHASILQRCKLTHGFIEGVFLEKNITYEDLEVYTTFIFRNTNLKENLQKKTKNNFTS